MEAPLLLIADSNPEFREALARALQGRYCVHCCGSGREALALLWQLQPEILVLDLMLPELDGLTILQTAAGEGWRTVILATTPLVTGYVLEICEALGVSYLMRQPCDVPTVARRVEDLSMRLHTSAADPHGYIDGILRSLRFVPTHHGFRCLLIAAVLAAQNPNQSMTKELYPEVGKRCEPPAVGKQVEKQIRYAIDVAWKQRDAEIWDRYFPTGKKPTNQAFISRLADLLMVWQSRNGRE